MPRNPSTGLFTRVSNSFSDPVVGTVIDQDDGIALFEDYDAGLTNTVAIGASQTILPGDQSQILTNLGATTLGKSLFASASAAAARTTLGATTVGSDLFTAANASAARTTLGATTVGSNLFTATDAPAARSFLGATTLGNSLFTAANASAARTSLGSTTVGDALFTAASTGAARTAIGAANIAGDTFTGPTAVNSAFTARYITAQDGTAASTQVTTYGIGWSSVYSSWAQVLSSDQSLAFAYYNYTTGAYVRTPFQMYANGNCSFSNNVNIVGTMTAGSKSFLIDHPKDPQNKNLVFTNPEAPKAGVEFWGTVRLVAGEAVVDIDAASNLMPGTFSALSQRGFVDSLNNLDGFTLVRASRIDDGTFSIIAADPNCADEIAWHVLAERADAFIKDSPYCDPETGILIPEHDKLPPATSNNEDKNP